ncbi:MAG: hypothetical protein WBL27_06550 [Salinimicrobium sp.]
MKKYFKIFLSVFITLAIAGCNKDDDSLGVDLEGLNAPSDLGATFQITQDNSGLVTIIPNGVGANLFSVDFGDGSASSDEIRVGESVTHVYDEGQYDVVINGTNLAGETAEGIQPLTVSFRAPENLEVAVDRDPEDNYTINVSASADYAAMFNVYFGDAADEEPTPLMPGETVSHTYATTGTFDVRVVALSGGEATLEATQEVVITDPLYLPIDFESAKLNYAWSGFGGASGQVIDNPDMSGINSSAKVAELSKSAGAETWAGMSLQLDEPLDFSQGTAIKMNVWSPEAGVPILFKIEDTSSEPDANGNPTVFVEIIENTTTSGEWEEMTFDLTSSGSFDPAVDYDRIIVFYDFGNTGEGTTFYFDDIMLANLEPLKLPITFDSSVINYAPETFNGTSFEVVANPDESGANNSPSMVGAVTNSGVNYEGLSFNLEEPVDFSSDNKTITMKVWSDVALPVLLKFEGGVNGERQNEVVANHTGSGWEELSFNFATDATKSYIDGSQGVGEAFVPTGQYATMTIFLDGPGSAAGTFYLDDIRKEDGNGDTEYISLFSDVATDVAVGTWRTDWSVSDYEEIEFDGQLTKHYFNLGYVGIEPVAPIDASNMTYFHLEVYTENATAVKVKLVDFGPDGVYAGDDLSEHELTFDNLPQDQWVTLDIPLVDFTNLTGTSNIAQYILSGVPYEEADVYVRNIYFHN